jgi:hypothetical protein
VAVGDVVHGLPITRGAANHRRERRRGSQSREGSDKRQPITGEEQEGAANHRRGERSGSQ